MLAMKHKAIFHRASDVFKSVLSVLIFLGVLMAVGALLTGCAPSLAPHGAAVNKIMDTAIDTGIKDIKDGNDRLAEIVTASSCGISVGAWSRLAGVEQQLGTVYMCPEFLRSIRSISPMMIGLPTVPQSSQSPPTPVN